MVGLTYEVKHPFAYLVDEEGSILMFEIDEDTIQYFDDIPANYPRWSGGTMTIAEAKAAVKRLVSEGWELIEYRGDEH